VCPLNNIRSASILCYVTDRHSLPSLSTELSSDSLTHKIHETASAGVDWVQLREKDLATAEWLVLARNALNGMPQTAKTRLLVNDRLDVAFSERAGGVHLSENGFPLADVRKFVGSLNPKRDFLVGVSCHSLEAAQIAEANGADYIIFGHIFETPSKTAFGRPQGLDRLAKACEAVSIPVIAIGGITLSNARLCKNAGASGIAAIRLFQDAKNLETLVNSLRDLLS
jgi:thiamine-phosphate pyrophosphorylase